MVKKILKNIDYLIYILIILIFCIGIVGLYSASQGAGGNEDNVYKQIAFFVSGLIISIALIFIDYRSYKKIGIPIYIIMILMLIAVLFTNRTNGATSWFKIGALSLQPAEFFKVAIIIMLAKVITNSKEKETFNHVKNILFIVLVLVIPLLLIIKQPDYGTAIVILLIACSMLFVGEIKKRYIVIASILLIIGIPILYNYVLPEHAKARINVYLNPELDSKGSGYNIIQSKLAVGSGMLMGMGVLNGNQTQLGMLPMKMTDFIFSVISEEMGFVASATLVILYVCLLYRIVRIAMNSKDEFGKLICIGVFTLILIHFVQNIGMCIGLLPITGIPLPFISYGGSSMLTNFIAIGICESISARRKSHNY
ncbi:MAG: rod shape-determining protein RodA [Clostridia bacterium]|nr:rod shape-determining protein RodA [Clostridia bacterium]